MIGLMKQWCAATPGRGLIVGAALAVATGLIALAGLWNSGAPVVAGAGREVNPKCIALARAVAGRAHSLLDSERYRATERQAYDVCRADPVAFRHIVSAY